MGLFKKKSKDNEELPPLPEELPPIEDVLPENQVANSQKNIHDQIPSDIDVHSDDQQQSLPDQDLPNQSLPDQDFSPDNLPDVGDIPPMPDDFQQENEDAQNQQMPNQNAPQDSEDFPDLPDIDSADDTDLPDLPDLPQDNEMQPNPEEFKAKAKKAVKKPARDDMNEEFHDSEPMPDADEEVPKPPAIFSEGSMYETPEEIKEIVSRRKVPQSYEEANDSMQTMEAPGITSAGDRPVVQYHHNGPIFVNIEAFKSMLGNIETIKNDIKSSESIMKHLDDIKTSKDKELELWRRQIEDLQNKITYIDKVLFEA